MSETRFDNIFKHHPPKGDQADRYQQLRDKGKEMALLMDELCPADNREKSLALTKLEEAIMWANASIARHG